MSRIEHAPNEIRENFVPAEKDIPERTVTIVRKLELGNDNEIELYRDLLIDSRNTAHFPGIYKPTWGGKFEPMGIEEFKKYLKQKNVTALAGLNRWGRILSFASIEGSRKGVDYDVIGRLVVRTEYQGGKEVSTGETFLEKLLEEYLKLKQKEAKPGKIRYNIGAEYAEDVDGWPRVHHLYKKLGFQLRGRTDEKGGVYLAPGQLLSCEKKPVDAPNGRIEFVSSITVELPDIEYHFYQRIKEETKENSRKYWKSQQEKELKQKRQLVLF